MAFDDVVCEGICSPENLLNVSSWIGGRPALGFTIPGGTSHTPATTFWAFIATFLDLAGLSTIRLLMGSFPYSLLVRKLDSAQLGYDKFAMFILVQLTLP
jgi:hypothetical protein